MILIFPVIPGKRRDDSKRPTIDSGCSQLFEAQTGFNHTCKDGSNVKDNGNDLRGSSESVSSRFAIDQYSIPVGVSPNSPPFSRPGDAVVRNRNLTTLPGLLCW